MRRFAIMMLTALGACEATIAEPLLPPGVDPVKALVPDVSLIHLIVNPRIFDGVDVEVVALATIDKNKAALFLHRADYENSVLANSVGLELPEGDRSRLAHPCYVEVEGMFIMQPVAGSGQVGKIQVRRMEPWVLAKDPKECGR